MIGIQEQHSGVARRLSVDLERVDVSETGFWWCRHCHRITEAVAPEEGGAADRCAHCGSKKLEWKPPIGMRNGECGMRNALPEIGQRDAASWRTPEAAGLAKPKRLPAERRDLRVLARTGYWFCYAAGCRQITDRDEAGRCALCGADEVEWQAPVFGADGKL